MATKKKTEKNIKRKFKITPLERIRVMAMLPQKGEEHQISVARDIMLKIELSDAEIKALGIKSKRNFDGSAGMTWDTKAMKKAKAKEYEITKTEAKVLNESIDDLSAKKEIELNSMETVEMIRSLGRKED